MTHITTYPMDTALPLHFRLMALSVPVLIAGQLFLVGLAVFSDGAAWDLHRELGGFIGLPVSGLLLAALLQARLRAFRLQTGVLFVLYGLQFLFLAAGQSLEVAAIEALHPANAVLLTATAVLLARRVLARAE